MSEAQRIKYAKAVMLGQRIYLNNQAMLNNLSRNTASHNLIKNKGLKKKFQDSLKDLSECINDFEEITKIDLSEAKKTLTTSIEALNNDDTELLYVNIQKLYRDDYLPQIISLLDK